MEWLALHGVDWGLRVVSAIIIFIVGRWIAGLVFRLMVKFMERSHVEPTLAKFIGRIGYALFMAVVIMSTVDKLGVNTTSFVAIVGAAGLAVGLAMQSSLSNFAAGVMIILFRPFPIGNFIDAGGIKGIVEEISIFNTQLRTPDNLEVIVPNSQIHGSAITNFSAKDRRRVDITFGVSYDDVLKVAKTTIGQILTADERILKDPAPIVGVMNLGESSVDIVCWAWVKSSDFLPVKFHLNETVKTELVKAGCSLPYPQRDVHLFSAERAPA